MYKWNCKNKEREKHNLYAERYTILHMFMNTTEEHDKSSLIIQIEKLSFSFTKNCYNIFWVEFFFFNIQFEKLVYDIERSIWRSYFQSSIYSFGCSVKHYIEYEFETNVFWLSGYLMK